MFVYVCTCLLDFPYTRVYRVVTCCYFPYIALNITRTDLVVTSRLQLMYHPKRIIGILAQTVMGPSAATSKELRSLRPRSSSGVFFSVGLE